MAIGRLVLNRALCAGVLFAAAAGLPGVSEAAVPARGAAPDWSDCGDGFQCAAVRVPRDYGRPRGRHIKLALARLPALNPAERIGSLFINPGGPGGSGVDFLRDNGQGSLAPLNARFDLVAWDPRGVGASAGAIDCGVDQEELGIYAQPFGRPTRTAERRLVRGARAYVRRCVARNRRSGLLPYLHTANTARDLNRLRAAVGDRKLTYLGFSYGTQIGATYATFFPQRVRALALDGAVDVEGFVNNPIRDFRRQTQSFEDALGRFLAACRTREDHCGLGATNPGAGYEALLKRVDAQSLPAAGAPNPAAVDGDDLRAATYATLTQKTLWPVLSAALVGAQSGDGSLLRIVADVFYERGGGGILDPFTAISAIDGRWPAKPQAYLRDGRSAYRRFDHFWWNAGYSELAMGLWPVKPRGAYFGPAEYSRRATTALVVGTTHDPSTPYVWSKRLTADLGNARLLTMRGDGHTASFAGNSLCIDMAVQVYLEQRRLPPRNTYCRQEVPFASAARAMSARTVRRVLEEARTFPVGVVR